ncbi:twin-arginine translocation signal domain-containing protein [Natribaculum luteum]|uniref:Twin-arginine translocation signal domain-containing protein n=1 Tax=Natribaculum luteum TaxID=1586232 RepID=A0ABD5P5M9_9EURY|nr:twin-arginine translocation signal domain-containing protein [Natribaculum luteum]
MTDETYESEHDRSGDSRRSFMKKSALATGALVLGTGAASTAAAQDDGDVLVFSYDYLPNQDFEVLAQLDQSTTISILELDGEEVEEIGGGDDYDGYVIRYDMGEDTAGVTTFLFTDEASLSEGDTETMSADASMLSSDLNILSASLGGGDGNGGDEENGEENDTEEEDGGMADNATEEDNETNTTA